MAHARLAVALLPNPEAEQKRCEEHLAIHHKNYDSEGPKPQQLLLVWWEFPAEHWEELREGCQMNFLQEPTHRIHDNAEMDDEQRRIAAEFVDELMGLGVFRKPPPHWTVLTSVRMFVVDKEGQPGQWRVIADMLRGGQNDCIGVDPCVLPRVSHIVDQMYGGGYSAVVDLSKYFHNFLVHPDD
jgi:hypothetical protein